MIQISGLRRSFGDRDLFRDATLRVGGRDRLALVGPNGSGKTTLFEMICGKQSPDGGAIAIPNDVTLGYLAQETDALRGRTVIAEVLSAADAMSQAGHRLAVLLDEIEATTGDERDRLLAEYARLQERFEALGGYSAEAEARRICAGLGFRDADLDRPTDSLSGGWLMRVALAKLLLASPDVLLLDEPTNHLDLESVRWLERFLRTFDGAVLVISHDRDFMNALATRVVEIERGNLISYTGDYAAFVAQREQRIAQAEAAAAQQQRRVAQIETFVNRFRYKNTKARQVQSRIKMLEKMERIEVPGERRRSMKLRFPPPPRAGAIVLTLSGVRFGYDGAQPVYDDLDLKIERGAKVALVGPNGAGKTTLLKLCAGVLRPQGGERALGHNVELGYFAQHQIEALDPSNRVIEELQRAVPAGVEIKARDLLGRFLFSGDDIDKPVRVLSGGERTRLAMAKILTSAPNLLCLDEPTNHLDIWSRDALEDALSEYEGALLLITHDRHLIRSIADTIVEVVDGKIRVLREDYETYLERLEAEAESSGAVAASRGSGAPGAAPAKERRRAAAEERAAATKHKRALRKVETDLEEVHATISSMEEAMAAPDFYTSTADIGAFMRDYDAARDAVKALEAEWDRLTEQA